MATENRELKFKTICPFFEQERDGIKPFTTRLWDDADPRFRALAERHTGRKPFDTIRITNPVTGESFTRRYHSYRAVYIPFNSSPPDWKTQYWVNIFWYNF